MRDQFEDYQYVADQLVPLGRPNLADDGVPMRLERAVRTSPVQTAYLRREPDWKYLHSRLIVVLHNPEGQWQVHEVTLLADNVQTGSGPVSDLRDAVAFCAHQLWVPPESLWYPALGRLIIEASYGVTIPIQTENI